MVPTQWLAVLVRRSVLEGEPDLRRREALPSRVGLSRLGLGLGFRFGLGGGADLLLGWWNGLVFQLADLILVLWIPMEENMRL